MKLIPILILALLVGCKTVPAKSVMPGAALAQAEQLGDIANTSLKIDGAGGIRVAIRVLDIQAVKFNVAATDYFRMAVEKNDAVDEADYAQAELKAEQKRFFSAIQRRLWWLALTIWASLGVLSILAGVFGFMGASAFLMRILPFSNVFALIRDRIIKARGDQQPVTVNITNVPASAVDVKPS